MMRNRATCVLLMAIVGLAVMLAGCSGGTPNQTPTPPAGGSPTETPSATDLGGRLLFSQFVEATHTFADSFTSRPDGSDITTIPMPGPEGGARWSRSGKEIAAMTVLADGRIGTAIISPDGKVLRVLKIPDATLNLVATAWSWDDDRIAGEAWDDANPTRNGIYSVRASDGGDLQRLTTPPKGMHDLPGDYSPDGQFVFKRNPGDEGPGPLMLVDSSGGTPRTLYNGSMEDPGRFAPDGRSVVSSENWHIKVINMAGKVLNDFTQDGAHLFGPAWSPDGARIVFSMGTGGPFAELYTSLSDGTDRRQVTHTTENEIGVDWGP